MDEPPIDTSSPEEEEDIEAEAQKMDSARFPVPTSEVIEKCRNCTPAEIARIDESIVEKGMFMFFDNKFCEAESLFSAHYQEDPMIANAYGTLGAIRALLSFESSDIEEACNRLLYSNSFAHKVSPKGKGIRGAINTVGTWFGRAKAKNLMSCAEFRALVCMGEAELLRAMVILLNDSITAYLKAGLALRRGYNIYDRLQKYVKEYPDEHGADAHSLGGMHFGLGAIHVTTSILPPKILSFLKALGYMHDREIGFQHLQRCLDSKTLRSPIASLFMLAFHGMLPSFAPLLVPHCVPQAERVIQQTLTMFPTSVIHLWLSGRVTRLKKQIPEAVRTFEKCVAYGDSMKNELPQLKHFAQYDLGFTLCSQGSWAEAAAVFQCLEEESNWSRMFYAYAQGCIYEEMGQFEKASDCFRRAAEHVSVKIAGKVISIEQFVKRRLPQIQSNGFRTFDGDVMKQNGIPMRSASCLELLMHFNVFPQMQTEHLKGFLSSVRETKQGHKQYLTALCGVQPVEEPLMVRRQQGIEWLAVLSLAEANLLRELTHFDEADSLYDAILADAFAEDGLMPGLSSQSPSRKKKGVWAGQVELLEETWIKPYALYEQGLLCFRKAEATQNANEVQALRQRGKQNFDKITKVYKGKDYSFEMQMGFRLHLTNDLLKHEK